MQEKNKAKQHIEKVEIKNKGKHIDNCTPESTPKRKNKPSKRKRDAVKRKQNKHQSNKSE